MYLDSTARYIDGGRMRTLIAIFLLVCLGLWVPAKHYVPVYGTKLQAPQPAGEITAPFRLQQLVHNSNSAAKISVGDEVCVGLRFATYQRQIEGQLTVTWQQAPFAKRWLVNARSLTDNQYSYFCPADHFNPAEDFSVTVEGKDGVAGSAATVWLTTDASLGHAVVNGRTSKLGLNILMAREIRMIPAKLARVDHGAFLIGWLCTVLTGLAALLWLRQAGLPVPATDEDARAARDNKTGRTV